MSKELGRAVGIAQKAFDDHEPAPDEREDGFESDRLSDADTHLRKACRALQLAHELLAGDRDALVADRFFTAAIELAFACIERTSSAALIATGRIRAEEMPHHADLIDRSHEAGVCGRDDAERLAELYDQNRSVYYYRRGIPSKTKAVAIVEAATEFHRLASKLHEFSGGSCLCEFRSGGDVA